MQVKQLQMVATFELEKEQISGLKHLLSGAQSEMKSLRKPCLLQRILQDSRGFSQKHPKSFFGALRAPIFRSDLVLVEMCLEHFFRRSRS